MVEFLKEVNNQLLCKDKIVIVMDASLFKAIKTTHSVAPTSAVSIDYNKYVRTLYIFKVLYKNELYDMFMPIISNFEYSSRKNVVINSREFVCYTLEADSVFLESITNVKTTDDLKLFLDKYLAGKFQNIPYEKQLYVIKEGFRLNTTKGVGVNDVAMETLIRSLNRTTDNINVPYSNIYKSDPTGTRRLMVPMKTIIMTEANGPSDIGFEFIHNTLTNVLLNSEHDSLKPLSETDKLLHGIK